MSCKYVLPYYTSGVVVKGFGRGSKTLGIPTGIPTVRIECACENTLKKKTWKIINVRYIYKIDNSFFSLFFSQISANLSETVVNRLPKDLDTGIYYGWAALQGQVYKMVTSIGWNPYYKNEKKSVVNIWKTYVN